MGGFGDVLGHVAGGFEQARQADLQRQFVDEQNRRAFIGSTLQKLAFDENQHPDVRNAALQGYIQLGQMGPNQAVNVKKLFDPIVQAHVSAASAPRPDAQFTPPPAPPLPGTTVPIPSRTVGLGAPPVPPTTNGPPAPPQSLLASAGEVTQNLAQRAGAVTSAQAGAELKAPIYTRQPDGSFSVIGLSGTGQPMGTGIPNAVSPYMMQGRGLNDINYIDPSTGQPALGTYNKMTQQVLDQQGRVVPNATPIIPSLLPTTDQTFRQVQQADGSISLVPVTTTTQKQLPKVSNPPAPPKNGATNAPPAPPKSSTPSRSVGAPISVGHTAPSPEVQKQTQEQVQMRNQTVDIIDDIMRNKSLFDSLISSGKIQVAANPDGSGIVQRAEGLSPEEARVASDFAQLAERVNVLRLPLGGGGFRSGQAWAALQGLRGKPTGDPQMTQNILRGTRSALVGLNDADMKMMQGKGTDTTAMEPTVGGHKVGDVVGHRNGRDLKITKIYPDGTFDADEVKK